MKINCNLASSRFLATQKKAFSMKLLEMYSIHNKKNPYNYILLLGTKTKEIVTLTDMDRI